MQVHSSGEVLKLEPYCPWKTHLFSIEMTLSVSPSIKYMLYQESTSSKWRVQVYRDPVHMTLYGSGPLTILHTCGLRHTCRVYYSLFAPIQAVPVHKNSFENRYIFSGIEDMLVVACWRSYA